MNRRNKRTSYEQYNIYLDAMEADPLLAANKLPRTQDMQKWRQLSDHLNKCPSGPNLTPEEWRKRLNDWKNSTHSKHRRGLNSTDSTSTHLENRALAIFFPQLYKPEEMDMEEEQEQEAEEQEEEVEDEEEEEDEDGEEEEEEQPVQVFEEQQLVYPQTEPVIINGHATTAQRVHLEGIGALVYQVANIRPQNQNQNPPKEPTTSTDAVQQIKKQLKRISDIKEATLHFHIATFKYKNPGFEFVPDL
ncbi:hypothetical protein KR018_011718 [Drosophila ironensis]|nr:hypothetical protein KR018_011718 [Drosophila ironensis]